MNKQDRKSAIAKLRSTLITRNFKPYAQFSDSFSYRKELEIHSINPGGLIPDGHHDVLVAKDKWITSVRTNASGAVVSNISVELKTDADLQFIMAQF